MANGSAGRHPDMLLLHYTGMTSADAALKRLCSPDSDVSCHYVITEEGRIIQCVPEQRRAWHAGEGWWAGETDINSCSIGVEIVNPGHDYGYPDFPRRQIAAVAALGRAILRRRTIKPERILGHSDTAPSRKQDPGEKFPWMTLHHSGVGHWVKPAPIKPDRTSNSATAAMRSAASRPPCMNMVTAFLSPEISTSKRTTPLSPFNVISVRRFATAGSIPQRSSHCECCWRP